MPRPESPIIPVMDRSNTTIPVLSVPEISVDGPSKATPIPTISFGVPSISVDPPAIPTINVHDSSQSDKRPLPKPKSNTRPLPHKSSTAPARPLNNWSHPRHPTAGCSQCGLPIAGRIVGAAGERFHPECFVCFHCGEHLECVAFYPEPDAKRAERIQRYRDWEAAGGQGDYDIRDGDESLRFYCHLDFHELFSPRCKQCKTPIEGEVVVACGAEWHVGHFFCAECGDVRCPALVLIISC